MQSTLPEEILARLDLVVLERLPDGVFVRIGAPPPQWFADIMRAAGETRHVTLAEALPFLEHFLTDAENHWRAGGQQRLRSETFVATHAAGGEVGLTASALSIGHRHLLFLELAGDFDERRRALQSARENVLDHEAHVRRTGALRTPLGVAQKLAQQLARSGLTPAQQDLADELARQLTAMSETVDSLAPLPKGVTRSGR